MDFYIDIGAAVLLRLLKNKTASAQYLRLFAKIYHAIEVAFDGNETFDAELTKLQEASAWTKTSPVK